MKRCGMQISAATKENVKFLHDLGLNAIQQFTLDSKVYTRQQQQEYKDYCDELDMLRVVHAQLSSNLASEKVRTRMWSINSLVLQAIDCDRIGADILVVHPGSAAEDGMKVLIESLRQFFQKCEDKGIIPPTIAVETMCGAGNQLLTTPQQCAELVYNVRHPYLGLCLDTAHSYGAGYTPAEFVEGLNNEGCLGYLRVVHFNNTKSKYGSKKERHTNLQLGNIKEEDYIDFVDVLNGHDVVFIEEAPAGINMNTESQIFKRYVTLIE